jgi:type I restriction enzyme, S subunit
VSARGIDPATVTLGQVLEEFDERLGSRPEPEVLTLTEKRGFIAQRVRFNKRLAIADTSDYKLIGLHDIAFNPYLLWASAIAQNTEWQSAIISPLYPTFRVQDGYDPRFVNYVLHSGALRSRYDGISFGSVPRKRRAAVPDFLSLRIPQPPPLPEQRRIAGVLDRAEALRVKRRAALAVLDTLTQSIFLEMFGDPIVNTRNWPKKKLSELGTLDRGVSKHRPRNAPELLGGPHPFVQTGDVANSNGYIRSFTSTYSDAGLRQSKMWPAGTLCITIAANIAKTGVLTFEACFPDSVVGFSADDPATVEFVRSWLSFLQASLERSAPESAQKNINLEILRGLDVPTPEVGLQRIFVRRLAAVEALKDANRAGVAELDALFASLQNHAFRGDL